MQWINNLMPIINIIGFVLTIVGLFLTIIGLVVTFKAYVDAINQGKNAQVATIKAQEEYKRGLELSQNYNTLVKEFQGRILDWEDLINELAERVSEETEGMWLALDTLAYGAVSVPDAHTRFWRGLLGNSVSGIPIEIVTFNKDAQKQMLKKQFGDDVAREPTEAIQEELQRHLEHIQSLKQQGKENVKIYLSSYFPLHLFIFKKQGIAILALQEIVGNGSGSVRARAIRTHDRVMVQICLQSFYEMRDFGENIEKLP